MKNYNFLILIFLCLVCRTSISDREMAGIKGEVKSVRMDWTKRSVSTDSILSSGWEIRNYSKNGKLKWARSKSPSNFYNRKDSYVITSLKSKLGTVNNYKILNDSLLLYDSTTLKLNSRNRVIASKTVKPFLDKKRPDYIVQQWKEKYDKNGRVTVIQKLHDRFLLNETKFTYFKRSNNIKMKLEKRNWNDTICLINKYFYDENGHCFKHEFIDGENKLTVDTTFNKEYSQLIKGFDPFGIPFRLCDTLFLQHADSIQIDDNGNVIKEKKLYSSYVLTNKYQYKYY